MNSYKIDRSVLLIDLFKAYYDTRKTKRNTNTQLYFELEYEHNLSILCDKLLSRTYVPSPSVCFITNEPVKREIFASPFSHRIVCRLLYNYISPFFESKMIYDSYSCRKGKGVFKGIERMEHNIRSVTDNWKNNAWALSADLQGYFMSINKNILYEIISRELNKQGSKIRGYEQDKSFHICKFDKDFVDYLLQIIIFRDPTKDSIAIGSHSDWDGLPSSKTLWAREKNVGLAIGDITSQLFSNIYLNELDQYVKRILKCRWYGRYVDDFYILSPSKKYLEHKLIEIASFLESNLSLKLHPHKITIKEVSKGVKFVGAFFLPHRTYPSKSSVVRFRKKMYQINNYILKKDKQKIKTTQKNELIKIESVVNSYCGHLSQFNSYNILKKELSTTPLYRFFFFGNGYSKCGYIDKTPTNNLFSTWDLLRTT